MYNGIINVYKEAGYTSHDVVAKLRGILGQKKIGHTGTLDPDATGVLPVCLGNGTKLCDMLTDKSKEYHAELILGKTTDTQDTSGRLLSEKEVDVTEKQVREAAESFVGAYEQIPPMYSAIKVNGKKLYQLAREGKEIERAARMVRIDYIRLERIELPLVVMTVGCSRGTYIRTLCQDIGEKLGCGGVMAHLERTRAGNFTLEKALKLSEIEQKRDDGTIEEAIIPVEAFFSELKTVRVAKAFRKLLDNGNSFYRGMTVEKKSADEGEKVRVYSEDNRFYGIFEYRTQEEKFKPVKMFPEK